MPEFAGLGCIAISIIGWRNARLLARFVRPIFLSVAIALAARQ
jgi:hypothetical protein